MASCPANILTKFFTGIDGLILFNYKVNKTDPYLITGQEARDMFFAGRVTQNVMVKHWKV